MNFAALGSRAEELIRRNGEAMTLVCVTQGAPSAETGLPSETESEIPFFGVWDALGRTAEAGITESADAVLWAAGLALPDPSIVDRVEGGGEAWRVLKVETIRGGGIRLLHKITLKRL